MFDTARRYKPRKRMRKVNWVKVPKSKAVRDSAVWQDETDLSVDIQPEQVEELFSRAEIKKKDKGEEEAAKPKGPTTVSGCGVWCVGGDLIHVLFLCSGKLARLKDQPQREYLSQAVQEVGNGDVFAPCSLT